MTISNTFKISSIIIVALVLLFALSLFDLWSQLARYTDYWNRQNQESAPANSIQYIALGDSTAQGIGATHPKYGYVSLVADQLAEKYNQPVHTINLSKSGGRVKDVLDTQLPVMQKIGLTNNTKVTIEIGANDIIGFDAQKFETEMDELMQKLPPQTVMSDIPYFGGSRYKSKQPEVEEANRIMYALAQKHNRTLVPLHQKIKDNDKIWTYAPDLFHPNNYSYRTNWAPLFIKEL